VADEYAATETQIQAGLAQTAAQPGRAKQELAALVALQAVDVQGPVTAAYLAAFRAVRAGGRALDVQDLADDLAFRLQKAIRIVEIAARQAFREVTAANLEEQRIRATTAHVDERGARWSLGNWAKVQTLHRGRQASSRGTADGVGPHRLYGQLYVVPHPDECALCQRHVGLAKPGDPLPPYHPGCRCTVSAVRAG
jgi:hypothetical protein